MTDDRIKNSISVLIQRLEKVRVIQAFSKDEFSRARWQKEIEELNLKISEKIEAAIYLSEQADANSNMKEDYNYIYSNFRLNNKNKMR